MAYKKLNKEFSMEDIDFSSYNREDKVYLSSDGKYYKMKDMEYTHLSNAFAKKLREIFNAKDLEDYDKRIKEIKDIQAELLFRINTFYQEEIEEKKTDM